MIALAAEVLLVYIDAHSRTESSQSSPSKPRLDFIICTYVLTLLSAHLPSSFLGVIALSHTFLSPIPTARNDT